LACGGEEDFAVIQLDYGCCKTASLIINFGSTHTASSYAHQVLHEKRREKTRPNEIAQLTDQAISSTYNVLRFWFVRDKNKVETKKSSRQ
jgi:hypothetical protein